jgi:hypothetical protein
MSMKSWPPDVRSSDWPASGIKYILEDRYLVEEKLDLWLKKAFEDFGHKTKYTVRLPPV